MPNRLRDLTGQSFGRWTVLKRGPTKYSTPHWVCKCLCGVEKLVSGSNLKSGNSKSCGCLLREWLILTNTTHGLGGSKVYQAFVNMHTRCYNCDDERKPYYQDKGIIVCDRWHLFENFFADMGHPPGPEYSLDRIDNDGNYEPGNCRWATWEEQAANRSKARVKS